jgi:hypothetical protein
VSSPPPANRSDHPAFLASCAFGALGVLLLLLGAVTGIHGLLYAGVGAGAASLVAALAWRSDLVTAWRRDHPQGGR